MCGCHTLQPATSARATTEVVCGTRHNCHATSIFHIMVRPALGQPWYLKSEAVYRQPGNRFSMLPCEPGEPQNIVFQVPQLPGYSPIASGEHWNIVLLGQQLYTTEHCSVGPSAARERRNIVLPASQLLGSPKTLCSQPHALCRHIATIHYIVCVFIMHTRAIS